MADLTTPPAPPADPPAPPPPADAEVTPPPSDPPAETPPPAPPAPVAEAPKWKLTRKGQEVEISDPEEVRRLAQMGFDYTQKTQQVAEYERSLRAEAQKLVDHFSKPENLKAALAALENSAPPPPPQPDDVPTVQTVERLISSQVAAARAQLQQEHLAAETARYTQEYTAEVDTTLKTLVTDKFPRLGDVDKIEKLIMDDVAEEVAARVAADPTKVVPMADVKKLIVESATRRHDKLTARDKEHEKMRLVREAKLTTKGTEPPGGGAAPPAPASKPHKLGSAELTRSVTAELQAAFSKK
jgi:hypothetical protein